MADYDQHLILHRLDDPLRILYWTLDEAGVFAGIFMLGFMFDYDVLGGVSALLGFNGYRRLKKRLGGGTLKHALYWYFPHNKRVLKITPPSYIREYVG